MNRHEPENPQGVGKMQYERPMPERMMAIEVQMERFLSDIEREEMAREQANLAINAKLDKISESQDRTNRIVYGMIGGLTVLQIVLTFIKH